MDHNMINAPPATPVILHYVAGGLEHGGGIGRLVGYILEADSARFHHTVVDTRGRRWNPFWSPFRLLSAMAKMALRRLHSAAALHHLHIAGRGSTARKLVLGAWARLLGAPYVLHLHDYDYASDIARRPNWQFQALRTLFQGAEQVIVLGKRDAATVNYSLGVPLSKLTVLRNCVPDPGAETIKRRTHNTKTSILFLGQLGPRKGVPELLQALADPSLADDNWYAVLAGDGAVDNYRTEAAQMGLAGRISFPGWVDADAADALREKADILVLPSHAEGFAMAVLEGLAQGLAVVTTRVGAHDEVLIDRHNSLLIPPGDVSALAQALALLIDDTQLRRHIASNGRQLFLDKFRIENYVATLENLLLAQIPKSAEIRSSA